MREKEYTCHNCEQLKIKYTWHNKFVIEHKFKSLPYLFNIYIEKECIMLSSKMNEYVKEKGNKK